MKTIVRHNVYIVLLVPLLAVALDHARAQDYPGYPYTIMTPERGGALHHRPRFGKRRLYARPSRSLAMRGQSRFARENPYLPRGSSGSVLPTPLPRTAAIPPEGGSPPIVRVAPAEQAPTVLPGTNPIPNLPHGAETFQDRASRCAFQQGLYNVPGNMSTQYMGACVQ